MKKIMIICLCGLALCGCSKQQNGSGEKIVTVRIGQLEERVFQHTIATQGVIEPVDHAVLSALMPGKLEELTVKEGDAVTKGQLLFRTDRINLENRCALAEEAVKMAEERVHTREADLKIALVSCKKAETDYRRNKHLFETKIISDDKFEAFELTWEKAKLAINQANAAVDTAKAEVRFAEAALRIAKKHLTDSCICAPYDGVVTEKLKNENESCNAGTPVLKIEKTDRKRISAVFNGQYYPQIHVNKTKLTVSFAGKEICTIPVSILSRTIDPFSRTLEVKADLPAQIKLPSGTLCDAVLVLSEYRAAALPEEVLLFRQNGTFSVFSEESGKAKEFPVRTGISRNGYTEILNPEKLRGKRIIISGHYFISDGSPVRIQAN